jgi:hypothetical protein
MIHSHSGVNQNSNQAETSSIIDRSKKVPAASMRGADNVAFDSNTLRKEILRKHAPAKFVAELSVV